MIFCFLLLTVFSPRLLCAASLPTHRPNKNILVIAHRTAMRFAPENTLAGIRKAIEMGADYIELDVRTSKDGVPVLMHDDTLNRTTSGTGPVSARTLAQIKALSIRTTNPAYRGEKVATLEEALAVMKGKTCFYWDAKEPPTAAMVALVKKYGFGRDCVVITTGEDTARALAALWPEAPLMPHFSTAAEVASQLARYPHLRALNSDAGKLDAAAVDAAHARGVLVFTNALVWQDQPRFYQKIMAELGSDGIQTDGLDKVFALRRKLQAQP